MKPDGYLGMTSWSGTGSGYVADSVSITALEVLNHDEAVVGEDFSDVSKKIQETYQDLLTDEHRHFLDEKSQTEHMTRLIKMVEDYVDSSYSKAMKQLEDVETL